MTDAMDALRIPVEPIDPDPAFRRRLRRQLEDALLTQGGTPMTDSSTTTTTTTTTDHEVDDAWGPTLTPYIVVADGRRAIDWYVDVFDGHQRGELYVNDDGTIGHAEVGIGDAVLMLSEPSPLWPDVPIAPPDAQPATHSHTLHVQVDDVDRTTRRAAEGGATVERPPNDQPYGRVAVIVDPFGHRWYLNQPPPSATRIRHGDIAYVTLTTPDDERAKAFFGAVLGWRFSPGSIEHGWNVEGRTPPMGLAGDPGATAGASLCYRVADMDAALQRVRDAGGEVGTAEPRPYGLLAECTDDQGTQFWLWSPAP
jgi:uncharacterized glyoxalase superfamily protein PhnB